MAAARLHIGTVSVEVRAREARIIEDRRLDLTTEELDLLAYLAARPGHTFSKAELLRAVWRTDLAPARRRMAMRRPGPRERT